MEKLINELRYGQLSRIWPACALALVKCFGPKFAAWLSYRGINWGADNTHPTILCLSRESFVKDIRELRLRTRFNYPMLMGGFTRFQMAWFPEEMQVQTFYQSYAGPGKESAIDMSTRYARHILKLVGKRRKVSAVLSANFDYWQDVGFKQVCKEIGIPFVVLSREHPIIPQVCDVVADWYTRTNYRFDGTAIAVAGRSTSEVLARVGTICKPDQVVITGLPRFDAWLDVNTNVPLKQRPWITLLTFTEGYYADETFKDVVKLFCRAAIKYVGSEIKFLIKTKDANDTVAVKKMLASEVKNKIACTHELDLYQVLPESRLVINFNSLSLVEAIMAGAEIAIPSWGECKASGRDVMYSIENERVSKVMKFAYSENRLLAIINQSILGEGDLVSSADAQAAINEFIYIPHQGSCSKEFEALLFKSIEKLEMQR